MGTKTIEQAKRGDMAKLLIEHQDRVLWTVGFLALNAEVLDHKGDEHNKEACTHVAEQLMFMLHRAVESQVTESPWHDDDKALMQADMSLHYHTLKDELLGIIEAREAGAGDGP